MARKHVPLRTCVQCQQVRPKRELIRVVRTPQGDVAIDEKGKAAGRGAYLCRDRACWEGAVSRDRLDYALKMKLNREHKERVLEYGEQLPYAQNTGSRVQSSPKKGAGDSQYG
jgi:predicted RNA-binding protein YlxR (DUF448 family)